MNNQNKNNNSQEKQKQDNNNRTKGFSIIKKNISDVIRISNILKY